MSSRNAWPVRTACTGVSVLGSVSNVLTGLPGCPGRRHRSAGARDDLRHPGRRVRDEAAVLVGQQQRHVVDVRVRELDAELLPGLLLDVGPRRQAAAALALQQLAGGDRLAVAVELVLAQEDLVRGMRRVGLVLVDERGRRVRVSCDVVGGAGLAVRAVAVVRGRRAVSTMKLVGLPGTNSGSSSLSGTTTVPASPFVVRSRPWSKNWPNSVNHELYGADRPTSGAVFG